MKTKTENSDPPYRIWWDEQENVARGKVLGKLEESTADSILVDTQKMADEHGEHIDWLIDLSEMSSATAAARQKLVLVSSHPSIRKYAFWGAKTFVRTMVNFINKVAGHPDSRHFASADEAFKWIRKSD